MPDPQAPSPKSAALVNFERMLASGKDSALLRYSIGNEHAKVREWPAAADALAAQARGDKQAAKEMTVFARRIERALASSGQGDAR